MIIGTNKSLYNVIIEHIINQILNGEIKAGDKITSVREQAKIHKINPQTVQKAYNILITEGIVISKVGSGNYLTEDSEAIDKLKNEFINHEIDMFIKNIKKYNIDKNMVIKRLEDDHE